MKPQQHTSSAPHLLWLYTESPASTLDAATWLDTTRELRQMGWRVTLIAVGERGIQHYRGVEVYCLPMKNLYLLRQMLFHVDFLALLIRKWSDIDVVLFHQISAPWLILLRLGQRIRRRTSGPLLVMDTRTLAMDDTHRGNWKARARKLLFVSINQTADRWFDGQTAITHRMAEAVHIPTHHLWGVWASGVNLEPFARAQRARQWPCSHGSETIRLIYIGSLHIERNLLTFCHAVMQANADGMQFQLLLVGSGSQQHELKAYAEHSEGTIHVCSPVSHWHIPGWLSQAHIGVLPFPDEEKFRVSSPIKLFEYLAAGLPILATQIDCHTDVVGDGAYAFWAHTADQEGLHRALQQAWQERSLLATRGAQAAAAAPNWTWQATAARLRTALEYGMARCHND